VTERPDDPALPEQAPEGDPADEATAATEPTPEPASPTEPIASETGDEPAAPEASDEITPIATDAPPDDASWSFFEPAPVPEEERGDVEDGPPLIELPAQVSDRYVVDETGEVLEVARESTVVRWWNTLGGADRRFYFGAGLVVVFSSFLYCLGITSLVMTPSLQPVIAEAPPTVTPTATATPFIVGIETPPASGSPLPTPTDDSPVFIQPTATRFVPIEPVATNTFAPLPVATSTFLPLPTATFGGVVPQVTVTPIRTSTAPASASTPTVPPANVTFTPAARPSATAGLPVPSLTPNVLPPTPTFGIPLFTPAPNGPTAIRPPVTVTPRP
jgi:hypothetical protein